MVLQAAMRPGNEHARTAVGTVSNWLSGAAKKSGLDIEGYHHTLDSSAIRHIRARHGDAVKEKSLGQIAITEDDIKSIPEVVSAPDRVVFGTKTRGGKEQIGIIKKMPDGSILYLEEVRTGKKELAATSMRKYPATTDIDAITRPLNPNVRNDGGTSIIIADAKENGKTAAEAVAAKERGRVKTPEKDAQNQWVGKSDSPATPDHIDNYEINFARINTPDDIKSLIHEMANKPQLHASIEEARRGTRTNVQTEAVAYEKNGWRKRF